MDDKSWFDVKQLGEGLFGIGEFAYVEEVISFLFVGPESAVLIDTGMGLFDIRTAVRRITPLPCSVLNTHAHFDHVGDNFRFEQVSLFDDPENRQVAAQGFTEDALAKWFVPEKFTQEPPASLPRIYRIPPFPQADFFADGAQLERASLTLTALHTPGHADGEVCFYEPERGWLFAGDLLYNGPIYIDKNGGLADYRASIEKLSRLDNLQRIFSSHNAFEFPLEKLEIIKDTLTKLEIQELETELKLGGKLSLVPY